MATRPAKNQRPGTMAKKRKHRLPPTPQPITTMEDESEDLDALVEDCEREMYGDDYDHLRDSGWLDR